METSSLNLAWREWRIGSQEDYSPLLNSIDCELGVHGRTARFQRAGERSLLSTRSRINARLGESVDPSDLKSAAVRHKSSSLLSGTNATVA